MIQVELSKIIIDEKRQDQIIVLREKTGERQFLIVIGIVEASSIKMKLSGIIPPRPVTHDLILSTIQQLEAVIKCLIIDRLVDNTFYAKLAIENKDGEKILIDCRPSDGIALAVRADVPIFAEEEVIEKASIEDQ